MASGVAREPPRAARSPARTAPAEGGADSIGCGNGSKSGLLLEPLQLRYAAGELRRRALPSSGGGEIAGGWGAHTFSTRRVRLVRGEGRGVSD